MALDTDLQTLYDAAKTAGHDNIMLDCLKQQDWRNAQVAAAAERDRHASVQQQFLAYGSDKSEDEDAYVQLFVALAGKYMSPGTAVDPVLVTEDAIKDAARLRAALAAAWQVYRDGIGAVRA